MKDAEFRSIKVKKKQKPYFGATAANESTPVIPSHGKAFEPGPAEKPQQIPDDLKNKVNALNAIFHCKTLLQIAPFTQPNWKAAADGIAFLDSLHANTLDQVKKHPQGHMVTIQEVNG